MNSFFKIAAVDIDARCNNVTPFSYSEMNKKQDTKTGRVFTSEDIKQAWATFMKITNSTKSRALPCCNPDIKISDVNPELLAKVQGIYSYARPIVKNGDLVELQLTKTAKASEAGWAPITPYIICKLSYALLTPGVITKSTEANDVWVVGKSGLLLDCLSASCPDSTTVDNLFGTTRKDPEYTYIDDASVARAIKDGDVKYVRDYLFKYNNANQVLTHDDYGNRLVHLATMYYRPKIFELLVAVKAKFNVRNAHGNTPLHLAVKSGNIDCIEQLLKLGGQPIEVNVKNSWGQTPLMMAISYQPVPDSKTGQISKIQKELPMTMIRYLYNHGANVLDRDANGNNMIHTILLYMQPTREMSDAVKFMLNKGVQADQKNNAGITPLMLAADKLKQSGVDAVPANSVKEGFWDDQTLLPSSTIASVNQSLTNSTVSSTTQPYATQQQNTPISNGNDEGVSEIDTSKLTNEQIELMEIRTLLFNDIIRNNPTKYNKFISVRDIPAGAPIEILDHNCVNATGEIISDQIETAEQCSAQPDGHWVRVSKPSTLIKLDLLPESKRIIDAVPDDKLYYQKLRPSKDAVPLPSVIQELNASVRAQMPTVYGAKNNTATQSANNTNRPMPTQTISNKPSNTNNTGNESNKEGFHPAIAGVIASIGHHMPTALTSLSTHSLGFLTDLTGEYVSKSIITEPPIDPDNLTSQNRPNISNKQATNINISPNEWQPVGQSNMSAELHPPIETISNIAREEFTAMKMTTLNKVDILKFLKENWHMIVIFIILAIMIICYPFVSHKSKKTWKRNVQLVL